MIPSTALGKGLGAALFIAVTATVGIAAALLQTGQGGEPPSPVVLDGIPLEEFTNNGVLLSPALPGETPALTAEAAVAKAERLFPGGAARQTLLLHVKNTAGYPPTDHLAWLVNFDPSTVAGSPPSGPDAPAGPYQTIYAYAFIDAESGELIFGGDKTGVTSPPPLP